MSIKKALLSMFITLPLWVLTGCDYIEKANLIDDLAKQQELQKSKIRDS